MMQFLRAVLRQDIGWYDTNTTSDFASKMTEDLNKIQGCNSIDVYVFWTIWDKLWVTSSSVLGEHKFR